MRLKKILKLLGIEDFEYDCTIKGFTRKEEEIKEGFLYFSFKEVDIKEYLKLKNHKALVIIGESNFLHRDYIKVDSIKKAYQAVLYYMNQEKLKNKKIIGVTGTNGKTTVSSLIYSFLSTKANTIYYGSNGIYDGNSYYPSVNTTPSMECFFKHLKNQKYIIIEISSISFFEYRTFNINLDYIILTNIYEDHLDYHINYSDYYYSKLLILSSNPNSKAIIYDGIHDDRILRLNKYSYYYGLKKGIFNVILKEDEALNRLLIAHKDERALIKTNLEGVYNINNLLAALTILYLLGFNLSDLERHYSNPIHIEGRLNKYKYYDKTIIIDYPHTTSAYETLLSNLKGKYKKKWLVIFGAGGNRQASKRKEYGKIVSKYAHYAIITNDNPRDEDELKIANEIALGLSIDYEIILDRKDAIKKGLELIKDYELLLILGKGKEDYIIKKGEKISHSDIKTVEELIKCS